MKTLFVGTGNQNKIKEIKDIFNRNNIFVNISSPKDFNIVEEPIENGKTFEENAIIKAKFYYDLVKMPTICEDSGICINHLNGEPGIYSKRFLGHLNDHDKNEEVIHLLENAKDRRALFYAVVAYIDERGNIKTFTGINEGEIANKQKGTQGFGYDPIFLIPEYNKTEAELGYEYKDKYSHRAKAFSKLIEYLKNEK